MNYCCVSLNNSESSLRKNFLTPFFAFSVEQACNQKLERR
jgi:hypothetical protein